LIKLIDIGGRTHYLAVAAVARVTEAGTSSQWHGIRAHVKLFDGSTIEATDTADAIARMLSAASKPSGDTPS
jgi:hypothetical protein